MENKHTSKLLSLLIPSYNRPENLARILTLVLLPTLKIHPDKIEVIISDNSDSETQDINENLVRALNSNLSDCECGASFRYYRNIQNIGYGKNLINLFNYTTGEYFWFISDGDELHLSGLLTVIEKLELREFEYYSIMYQVKHNEAMNAPQPALAFNALDFYRVHYQLPFMYLSGTIHRKHLCSLVHLQEFENFMQIFIFVSNMSDWKSFRLLDEIVLTLDGLETRRFDCLDTYHSEIAIINYLGKSLNEEERSTLHLRLTAAAFRRLLWDAIAIKIGYLNSNSKKSISKFALLKYLPMALSLKSLVLAAALLSPKPIASFIFCVAVYRGSGPGEAKAIWKKLRFKS